MQIRFEGRAAHVILGYTPGEVRLAERNVKTSALISAAAIEDWPVRSIAEFDARVGLEAMEIGAACRTYNVLVSEGRRVLMALIMGGPAAGTADPRAGPAAGSQSKASAGP